MANLFWLTKSTTRSLIETPFKTEEEFERTVFSTPDLLDDIFLLKRQIRGGGKSGIPDIVGVDNDGSVCILELKNTSVNASVIPQVLEYAIWAETNPDSIRSLWLEKDNKPEDIEVNWDNIEVRIIVLAPSIHRATLQFVERINYPVDLVEIKRWVEGDSQLIMVNKLEQDEKRTRVKSSKGLPQYDEAFYKGQRNTTSAGHFMRYTREVEQLIAEKGWALETKYNRDHCAFKVGFFNAFAIKWIGSKTFAFSFKIPLKETKKFKVQFTRYNQQRSRALYYIDPKRTRARDFVPLIEYCYKRFTGE
jgi:hypothetical protein